MCAVRHLAFLAPVKTKFLLPLMLRLALCAAVVAAAWGGLEALEVASRTDPKTPVSPDMALAGLAQVPVATPLVLQLTALLRKR